MIKRKYAGYAKEWYVQMHREMWNSIADEIERKKRVLYVPGLKEQWLYDRGMSIFMDCFACEFAVNKNEKFHVLQDCQTGCLFTWGDDCEFVKCMNGYYKSCLTPTNWMEQAALARKIENLSVRENV